MILQNWRLLATAICQALDAEPRHSLVIMTAQGTIMTVEELALALEARAVTINLEPLS